MNLPERDWRLLRDVHRAALERYCARVLDECAAVMREEKESAHERYLRLVELLRERDDALAVAFDDLRRSTAIQQLAAMINLDVVSTDDLSRFSPATRESATARAEIVAQRGKRPKRR